MKATSIITTLRVRVVMTLLLALTADIGSGEQLCGFKHGETLTVYGSGESWGVSIGGGEDSDGADVKVYGGKVIAWAGIDAIIKSHIKILRK